MKYYNAYEERYKVIHEKKLTWFPKDATPEIEVWLDFYSVSKQDAICEVGCGEGRDVLNLISKGYQVTGIDLSESAIKKCRSLEKELDLPTEISWKVVDMAQNDDLLVGHFDYIYSIATLHMLVNQVDRLQFLKNINSMLKPGGKLLLVNKGDGDTFFSTGTEKAFDMEERQHYQTGENIEVAATSFHSLKWTDHLEEFKNTGFKVVKYMNTHNDIYQNCMTVYLEIDV